MTEDNNTCPRHGNKSRRIVYTTVLVFILIAVTVTITVYFVLRPHRPHFMIQDATIYGFNVSDYPYLLSSTFQVTVVSRNPNAHVGVYYDKLSAYTTYNDQQITLRTSIPSSYQVMCSVSSYLHCTKCHLIHCLRCDLIRVTRKCMSGRLSSSVHLSRLRHTTRSA